jgi:exopolysaccharide biosynthesis polyprenyl glycosylphosphotransferase
MTPIWGLMLGPFEAEEIAVSADPTLTVVAEPVPAGPSPAAEAARVALRRVPIGPAARAHWQREYRLALMALDTVALFAGVTLAALLRWGYRANVVVAHGVDYYSVAAIMTVAWILALGTTHAYDPRNLGLGSEEFRRVGDAAIRVTALVAFATFVLKLPLSRGFVAMAMPIGLAATLFGRYLGRRALQRLRRRALCLHRVLVVGTPAAAVRLAAGLSHTVETGYHVSGTWSPSGQDLSGEPSMLLDVLARTGADTVAVASSGFTPAKLRDIAWQLEGSGVDLLVSPTLVDVAGPRIHIRPVAGLPLLHIEEPHLDGGKQLLKSVLDRLAALLLLVLFAPLLMGVAVAIRVTGQGPVLFRQQRLGRGSEPFSIYKFRTMYDGADERFAAIVAARAVENRGGMFVKVRADDRITPVGKLLRRFSIDELPQLLNVLLGHMSLVGPRPLPVSVMQDGAGASRRLLVRPGMSGLWQVSGRSDLPPDEAVRLDLYYVENWSPAADLMILWKTARAVVRGRGAY